MIQNTAVSRRQEVIHCLQEFFDAFATSLPVVESQSIYRMDHECVIAVIDPLTQCTVSLTFLWSG